MAESVKVRIAVQSARELEIDVEDGDATVAAVEEALADGAGLVWITDARGNRHGIVTAKLAFVEVQTEDSGLGVGFTP